MGVLGVLLAQLTLPQPMNKTIKGNHYDVSWQIHMVHPYSASNVETGAYLRY